MNKKQILWLSDTPTCSTGFATVSKNLLKELHKTSKYEFTVVGINHNGDYYDQTEYPYKIYPAIDMMAESNRYREPFGLQRFLDLLQTGQYDMAFILQDTFIIENIAKVIAQVQDLLPKERKLATIFYFPIDGEPKENWIKQSVSLFDFPVTYTNFAKEKCLKYDPALSNKLKFIYHGVNTKDFYPYDFAKRQQFRKDMLHDNAGKFLVVNVNRNQPRKDLARTLATFAEFHKKKPNSFLYLNCQAEDTGGNIHEMARNYDLVVGKDYSTPSMKLFSSNQGVPIEILNGIYNAADLVISTTLGEGWGLSTTEAMATKTPVVMPNNTSLPEICGKDGERGLLADSGKTLSEHFVLGINDKEVSRPLTNIDSMVEKMIRVYDHKDEASKMANRAYEWVKTITWEEIAKQWLKVFEEAENLVTFRRNVKEAKAIKGITSPNIGRNDPCPCLSGKKYKACCGRV